MSASSALSLRISPKDRDLIDRAAEATNKSRTEFMLDSARAAATDALLDRRLYVLDAKSFKAFEKALDKAQTVAEVIARLDQKSLHWKK